MWIWMKAKFVENYLNKLCEPLLVIGATTIKGLAWEDQLVQSKREIGGRDKDTAHVCLVFMGIDCVWYSLFINLWDACKILMCHAMTGGCKTIVLYQIRIEFKLLLNIINISHHSSLITILNEGNLALFIGGI